MMAFPSMIADAAKQAGMKVPEDPDGLGTTFSTWNTDEFPHFYVFCAVQLGRPCQPGEQFDNAKIIAAVDEDHIREVTLNELLAAGLRYQQ